jgi:hypothetical protein
MDGLGHKKWKTYEDTWKNKIRQKDSWTARSWKRTTMSREGSCGWDLGTVWFFFLLATVALACPLHYCPRSRLHTPTYTDPHPLPLLGLVRLHQSSSGVVWIEIKSMSQFVPQNNTSLLKFFYSVKPTMDYNPRVWDFFKLWKALILSITH